jgi:hypothetical protein
MNESNDPQQPGTPDWDECPPGEIGDLVGRLRGKRRQERVQAFGLAGAAAALLIAAGLVAMNRSAQTPAGEGILAAGIWCSEFLDQSDEYMAGQLDAARVQQMEGHLAECEHCRQKLREMQDSELPPLPTEADLHTGTHERLTALPHESGVVTLASR